MGVVFEVWEGEKNKKKNSFNLEKGYTPPTPKSTLENFKNYKNINSSNVFVPSFHALIYITDYVPDLKIL